MRRHNTLVALALLLIMAVTAAVYVPGLSGDFLFDDYANLPAIGAYGPVDDFPTFARYITSGTADPTGRPVAMATFLIDAQNWPAEPWPFKRTNLILQLINGLILAGLLWLLGRELGLARRRRDWSAVLGAGFWMVHPLFVSTTLYIIQRESMLAATFAMLGLAGYIIGRRRLLAGHTTGHATDQATGHIRGGALIAGVSLGLGTILATLSKANGALTPLLALVLEATVLAAPAVDRRRALNILRAVLIGLPVALLAAYMIHKFPADWTANPGHRPWSTLERILTEPRMLVDYLRLLWSPSPYTTGVFNDQIVASGGWLTPWTTLPAGVFIGLLFAAGVWLRRRIPSVSAAILFYFAGMVIESTWIALELYYEHRNYLPALLMFWPLAIGLTAPGRYKNWRAIVAVAIVAGLATMTFFRAELWGNTAEQARLWAKLNPASPRVMGHAASVATQLGHPRRAAALLNKAISPPVNQPQLTLNLISAECALGRVRPETLDLAVTSIVHSRRADSLFSRWFMKAFNKARASTCTGLDYATLDRLLDAAARNPEIAGNNSAQQWVTSLRGRLALARNNTTGAIDYFHESLRFEPEPAVALKQAAILGTAGRYCAALGQLRLYHRLVPDRPISIALNMESLHAWVLQAQGYWQHEFRHLRQSLKEDARHRHRHRHRLPCPTPAGISAGNNNQEGQ